MPIERQSSNPRMYVRPFRPLLSSEITNSAMYLSRHVAVAYSSLNYVSLYANTVWTVKNVIFCYITCSGYWGSTCAIIIVCLGCNN